MIKAIFASLFLMVLLVWLFFWNEARKEIYFLCGNFGPGVTEANVLRQLETVELVRFEAFDDQQGKRYVMSPGYFWLAGRCDIRMDHLGVVTDVQHSR